MGFSNRTGAEIEAFNLIENVKNHFSLLKKLKNTESAQLCPSDRLTHQCLGKKQESSADQVKIDCACAAC